MAKDDWEKIWADQAISVADDQARLSEETNTLRWVQMVAIIQKYLGDIAELNVIEVGAGVGDFSIILNQLGARTTLADYSPEAIEKAKKRFKAHGLTADYVLADMLNVPSGLRDKFDMSFSLGLGEHFDGQHRADIIAAHAQVLRPGGLTFISVPYRYSPAYRLWMRSMIKHDSWAYGLEIPFSKREIKALGERAGLESLGFIQSSFFGDWDRFFPRHHVKKIFGHKIEQKILLNNLGYALVYVGRKRPSK
jgi:SAM-dependent methyltransferase